MLSKNYDNVFDALEDNPNIAYHLKIRSELMILLCQSIRDSELNQKEHAKVLGVSQPRISDLMRGKIQNFSIGWLIDKLALVGKQVSFSLTEDKK